MNVFDSILNKINTLDDITIGRLLFSDPSIHKLIIKLNTEKQLFIEGVDAEGKKLPLYKTNKKGLFGKPYNLKDTGDLYKSFTVSVNSNGDAVVEADYIKGKGFDLRRLTKSEFVGLTDKSETILQQKAEEVLQSIIVKALALR